MKRRSAHPPAVGLLVVAATAFAPTGADAQLCQRGSASIIASLHVDRIGEDPRTALGFSFEPFDRVLLGGGLGWGGVDTGEETPRFVYVVTGGRLSFQGVDLCPWVEGGQTRFDFRDRFDADRGAVAESTLEVGVEVSRVLTEVAGVGIGARAEGALGWHERTMARRWLTLVPPLGVDAETTTVRGSTWEASTGLSLQGRSFVLATGVTAYEYFERHLAGFVEVSLLLGVD